MRAINLRKLVTSLAIPLAVGFFSWLFTMNSQDIYSRIVSPPLAPPGGLFPVVWTLLFILMGISLYIVRTNRSGNPEDKRKGYIFFALQLIFNFLWSIVFFNFGFYWFSAVWLVALIVLIILNIFYFATVNKSAGWLLVPYLLWCAFALYLNIGIAILN